MAVRFAGTGMEAECFPVRIEVDGLDKAVERGLEIALERWPMREYWGRHQAVAVFA